MVGLELNTLYLFCQYDGRISDNSLIFGGETFNVSSSNSLSLTEIDSILYYNLLDNTFWTTLDLGIDIRYTDFKYNISDSLGLASYNVNEKVIIPLGYIRSRIEIPMTGIVIDGEIKYISFDRNTISDFFN